MSKREWWTCYFLYRVRPVLWCMGVMLAFKSLNGFQPLCNLGEYLVFGITFGGLASVGAYFSARPNDSRYCRWRWHRHGYTGQPQVSAEQYLNGLAAERQRLADEKARDEDYYRVQDEKFREYVEMRTKSDKLHAFTREPERIYKIINRGVFRP